MMSKECCRLATSCEKGKQKSRKGRRRTRTAAAALRNITILIGITYASVFMVFNEWIGSRVLLTTSELIVALPQQRKRLYICGFGQNNLHLLFPQHTVTKLPSNPNIFMHDTVSSAFDILLVDGGSYKPKCESHWANAVEFHEWSLKFPGKIVVLNGESKEMWYSREKGPGPDQQVNLYRLGYYTTGRRTMRFTFCQQNLLKFGPTAWKAIMDPKYKPRSTKERFAVFATSNCKQFRKRAAERLAEIGLVHNAGRCFPELQNQMRNIQKAPAMLLNAGWENNHQHFKAYRFCLTMENTNVEGYVTEKILNAFLAGCIPIYYGSFQDALAMFNQKAFIFYDNNDPASALERIRELETNDEAYDEVMTQPVLANGNRTIEEFFSFTSDVGNGKLIQRINKMFGVK